MWVLWTPQIRLLTVFFLILFLSVIKSEKIVPAEFLSYANIKSFNHENVILLVENT